VSKDDIQRYKTSTRSGDRVEVRHYKARDGKTTSMQADGRGYELLYLEGVKARKKK
jgi:hypothetical protein